MYRTMIHGLLRVTLLSTLGLSTAGAAWLPEGNPICLAAGTQGDVSIEPDGVGGTFVVWSDWRNGTVSDIYAQRLNALGTPLWIEDGVAICVASDDQRNPRVVPDGLGGAVIVWQDHRGSQGWELYAQRLDGSGNPLWPAGGTPVCTAIGDQVKPQIVADGGRGAIVVWTDYRDDAYPHSGKIDIYAQRIDSLGTARWIPATGVPVCATHDQYKINPQAVSDHEGGVIVAWRDNRTYDANFYAQRIDDSGQPLWIYGGVTVCDEVHQQYALVLVTDGAGGAVAAWEDERDSNDFPNTFAQRLDPNGASLWTDDGVQVCTAANAQYHPSLASNDAHGGIIAWEHYLGSDDPRIHAQSLDSGGAVEWIAGGSPVRAPETQDQTTSFAVSDGRDGAIILYTVPSTGYNLYAQRLDASGSRAWSDTARTVTPNSYLSDVSVTADGQGAAVVVWRDERDTGDHDLYAQRLDDLAPTAPSGVTGTWAPPPFLRVSWDANPQTDVVGYSVYRGYPSDFTPSESNRVWYGSELAWVDSTYMSHAPCYYKVTATDVHELESAPTVYDPAVLPDPAVAPAEERPRFRLAPGLPNPFGQNTTIAFGLAERADVDLEVFDPSGRCTRILLREVLSEGPHRIEWDGRDQSGRAVPSGVYRIRLETAGGVLTGTLIRIGP